MAPPARCRPRRRDRRLEDMAHRVQRGCEQPLVGGAAQPLEVGVSLGAGPAHPESTYALDASHRLRTAQSCHRRSAGDRGLRGRPCSCGRPGYGCRAVGSPGWSAHGVAGATAERAAAY